MFLQHDTSHQEHMRRGRPKCGFGDGPPPLYANVNMRDGALLNTWIDALQASYCGLKVLNGQIDEAICAHIFYWAIWRKYDMLPERYNWRTN